jgi:hypothetical protein
MTDEQMDRLVAKLDVIAKLLRNLQPPVVVGPDGAVGQSQSQWPGHYQCSYCGGMHQTGTACPNRPHTSMMATHLKGFP